MPLAKTTNNGPRLSFSILPEPQRQCWGESRHSAREVCLFQHAAVDDRRASLKLLPGQALRPVGVISVQARSRARWHSVDLNLLVVADHGLAGYPGILKGLRTLDGGRGLGAAQRPPGGPSIRRLRN